MPTPHASTTYKSPNGTLAPPTTLHSANHSLADTCVDRSLSVTLNYVGVYSDVNKDVNSDVNKMLNIWNSYFAGTQSSVVTFHWSGVVSTFHERLYTKLLKFNS